VTSDAVPETPHIAGAQASRWESLLKRLHIHPFRSWTLRTRIVLAVVALLTIVSLVIGFVSVLALQGYLVGRLDNQLISAVGRGSEMADRFFGVGPIDARVQGIVNGPGQPVGTLGLVLDNKNNVLFSGLLSPAGSSSEVSANLTPILTLPADGVPRTLDLGGGLGDYRVAAVQLANGNEMILGLSMSEVDATVTQLTFVVLVVAVAGLLLAIALATLIVRLTLRPLERVARTALEVSEMPLDRGDVALSIRVPERDTDIHTEVGKVGEAFNRMLGHVGSALAARQASEKKVRQFVADASHELRTPLASIRGYAELTRRGRHDLPDDVTHSIGRIESEATRMTSLVEDLLLLARLDEGRDLESDPVDLSILLVDVVSDAHAAGRDHSWSLDLPDEPIEVSGDQARLHQVIANLLTNARIHTPAGTEVKVALSVLDAPDREPGGAIDAPPDEDDVDGIADGDADVDSDYGATLAPGTPRAVITVSDNGPGIADDIAPTLFERFVRGDSSRTRATGSTGLGLAIVHAVVEAHGGVVTVESKPGNTVFRVELPLQKAELAAA
jgi:two-component system, OmpR family, sensor kinase